MIIDLVNLNHLRIFECVYRHKNMTEAAEELHLTQSGVSQHIKSLEGVLGTPLFDRIKRKLLPTEAAHFLHKQCSKSLYEIENALTELKGGTKQLSGTVSVGVPIEFGNNLVLPLLAQFLSQHSELRLEVKYGYAGDMNRLVVSGDLDFALIDEFGLDRRISQEWVYDERLFLCGSRKYVDSLPKIGHDKAFYEQLRYVGYTQGEPIIRMWFEHHMGIKHINLDVVASMMDVRGIARMVRNGVGVGVLPGHLVTKLERRQSKEESIYKFEGRKKPVINKIHLTYIKDKTHTPAITTVRDWLIEQLRETSQRGPDQVAL